MFTSMTSLQAKTFEVLEKLITLARPGHDCRYLADTKSHLRMLRNAQGIKQWYPMLMCLIRPLLWRRATRIIEACH